MATCKAITGKGKLCGCKVKPGSEFCGKHKNWSECPVCYSCPEPSKMTTLKCGHSFCTDCIRNWFCESSDIVDSCPCCRKESLIVLSEEHVEKKVQKCLRELDIPNKPHKRVYYVDKMFMYLNTKYGRDFVRTHDSFRRVFREKSKIMMEELREPQHQTEYYIENSKNIKEAYEYWKGRKGPL